MACALALTSSTWPWLTRVMLDKGLMGCSCCWYQLHVRYAYVCQVIQVFEPALVLAWSCTYYVGTVLGLVLGPQGYVFDLVGCP